MEREVTATGVPYPVGPPAPNEEALDERSKSPDSYTPASNVEGDEEKRLEKAIKYRQERCSEVDKEIKQKREELDQVREDRADAVSELKAYKLKKGAEIQQLRSERDKLRESYAGLVLSSEEKEHDLVKLRQELLEKNKMLEVIPGKPWSAEEKRPWVIVTPNSSTEIIFVDAPNVVRDWLTPGELKLLQKNFANDYPYFMEKRFGYILQTPSLLCVVNKNCVCSVYFKLEQSEVQSLAEYGLYKDMLNAIVAIQTNDELFRTKAMEIIMNFSVSCLWDEVTTLGALTAQIDGGLNQLELHQANIVSLLQDVNMFKDILSQAFKIGCSNGNPGILLLQSCTSVHAKLSKLSTESKKARNDRMLQCLVGDQLTIMNQSLDFQMKLSYFLGGGGYLASLAAVATLLFHEHIIVGIAGFSGLVFVGCCLAPVLPWGSRLLAKAKSRFRGRGAMVERGGVP